MYLSLGTPGLERSVIFLVGISDSFARDSTNSVVPTAFIIGIHLFMNCRGLIQPLDSLF